MMHSWSRWSRLLKTGKHSDFTITCGDKTWNVHRAVICSQSEFFDASARFGKEAVEAKVGLPEDHPEIVEYMIQYMYQQDYRVPSDDSTEPLWIKMNWEKAKLSTGSKPTMTARDRFKFDGHYWRWSAKYLVPSIAKFEGGSERVVGKVYDFKWNHLDKDVVLALVASVEGLKSKWSHVEDGLPINHRGLKNVVAEPFDESLTTMFLDCKHFFDAVKLVFTTTPDTDTALRSIVTKHICVSKNIYGMHQKLEDALQTIPGLVFSRLQTRVVSCRLG
ncbi:hypothetical protein BU23DRAFT_186363 [Bimuria novae-zelandiae CBS 107.79]|uniref:BTB domain-containing protein n=1 Tax=Bimuria novae-zelandiae CBS 107.79 TaxID=1447943 RepID=A0A6A5VLY5_9PLEO|nr:hypothetical protein BU23DRAFT_186363 [Bimuria novae-zelandiae CBS 107.79]